MKDAVESVVKYVLYDSKFDDMLEIFDRITRCINRSGKWTLFYLLRRFDFKWWI